MQDVVLPALFVIDHELQADLRPARPFGIRRGAAIAGHVTGVLGHGRGPAEGWCGDLEGRVAQVGGRGKWGTREKRRLASHDHAKCADPIDRMTGLHPA